MTETYTHATESEKLFVAWLERKSAGIEWCSLCWLETADGDCDDPEYCPECVEIQRRVEKHNKTGFTRICYGSDSEETDSPKRCERCGCLLYHSPTEYYLEEEIGVMEKPGPVCPSDAAIWHNMLTMNGCYGPCNRAEWWPKIEPHAKRMMAEAP